MVMAAESLGGTWYSETLPQAFSYVTIIGLHRE